MRFRDCTTAGPTWAQDTVRPVSKGAGDTDRRHTNFAVESIEQTFNGTVGWNKRITSQIARNGDLVTKAFLEITMVKSGVTYYPAEAVVQDVSFDVGGQTIDKHYNDWFRIYDELEMYERKSSCHRHLSSAGGQNSWGLNTEARLGDSQKLVACVA